MRRARLRWGQGALFGLGDEPGRFRVAHDTAWAEATASLPLAVAQARAVALAGGRAVICADDGNAVEVRHDDGHFEIATLGEGAGWPERVRSILTDHG